MWSRKQSLCSAVSGTSKCDDQETPFAKQHIYPFAIALRLRVLQAFTAGVHNINIFRAELLWSRGTENREQRNGVMVGDVLQLQPPKMTSTSIVETSGSTSSSGSRQLSPENIVCGIGGVVIGAVGWLEEREKPALGLGVPAGAVTVLAAVTSVYFSRGFGGWVPARSRSTKSWGAPWRALGPSPSAAIPLTILWTIAITAHIAMLAFCIRSLLKLGCGSRTCVGVAAAQLSVSISTLVAALFMLQMDLRYDPTLTPPRQSDTNTCTGVSMVPLNSVAINSGNSEQEGSPPTKEREQPADPPT